MSPVISYAGNHRDIRGQETKEREMKHYLFKDMKNRNIKAKKLISQGYSVKKSSIRNQLLHPEYVEDEAEYLREQIGLGNTVYKTPYSVLYEVEIIN